jgi:predicted nucleotidyltransferase
MESIKHKLTQSEQSFFENISEYIDKEIYFYGSIKRSDYIKGKSDIDIDIFTENENSTIQKLSNYLNIKKSEFRKIIYKTNNTLVYGYKTKYKDINNKINVEISIYNEKYKSLVLYDHNNGCFLPFYISFALIIVKLLYYNLGIISENSYKICKQFLMNPNNELRFILVDN